jgi:phenylpropionate dioxygenase-like ring-hydroxylating dioxygenase large terminal subunit
MNTQALSKLIVNQPDGFSLHQNFYEDPDIYQEEIKRIFMKSWLYVGHISQLPGKGDYFLYELDNESVIIVRDQTDTIRALLNVCRHRGSRVCLEASGHKQLLVCPYHAWTYQLDGSLRGATYTPHDFDKSKYGLKQINVELFQGMIFINFDSNPVPFTPIRDDLQKSLEPYRLDKAKIAHKENYSINANWKLAVENYCECYHCIPAHPEYSEAHGRSIPDEDVADLREEVLDKSEMVGLTRDSVCREYLNSDKIGNDRAFDRYPLFNGFLTGSRDGKPVAPLLGDIKGYDGGTTDIQIGPVTFYLAYCDHVVVYHFKPLSVDRSDCEITWLVREDAEEGKDYKLDELIWLWDITTLADKRIIEDNQAGVKSRFYQPGPFTMMEGPQKEFIDWYLEVMK